jgi:predicted CoA-binding protein
MLAAKTVAIVGLSDDPSRVSNQIGRYLHEHGFAITPINPQCAEVFGIASRGSLTELTEAPDLVLVFRRPGFCGEVAKQAVALGAKGLWLQSGITNEEAKAVCAAAGMPFVQDRCFYVEHARRMR